jgi:hypothetical protein
VSAPWSLVNQWRNLSRSTLGPEVREAYATCAQALEEWIALACPASPVSPPADTKARCVMCRRRVEPRDFAPGEPLICLECSEGA